MNIKLLKNFEFFPFSFMIDVTDACNLHCAYCNFKKGFRRQKLSPEEVLSKVKCFKAIVLTGGEPLLNFEWIEEFLRLAREDKITFNKILLFTNGTLLTDEIASFLKKYDVRVGVSLDGPGFVHDVNRVFPDGSGSFNLVMKGINLLKKHNVNFYVTSVLSHQNYDKVYQILTFMESLRINQVDFSILTEPSEGKFHPLSYEEYIVSTEQLFKFYKERVNNKDNLLINYLSFIPLPIFTRDRIKNNTLFIRPCQAGLSSFSLNVEGEVFPCHTAAQHPSLKYFNLSEINSFLEAKSIILDKYRSFVKKIITEQPSFEELVRGFICPIRGYFMTPFYEEKYDILSKLVREKSHEYLRKFKEAGIINYFFSRLLGRPVDLVDETVNINGKSYNILVVK